MSTTASAVILTAALTTGFASAERVALPRAVIEAGLKKAQCTIPPNEAAILGTERLSGRLEIVEVSCWRAAYNAGSILFAVPENRPNRAQLLSVETLAGRARPDRLQRVVAGLRRDDAHAQLQPQGARHRRLRHDPGNEMDRLAFPPAAMSGPRIVATASRSNGTAGKAGRCSRGRRSRGRASTRKPGFRPAATAFSRRASS